MCISRGCVVPVHKFVLFGKFAIFVKGGTKPGSRVYVVDTSHSNLLYFFPSYKYFVLTTTTCVLDAAYLEGLPGALFVYLHVRTFESRFPYSYNALYVRFTHWAPSGFICCFHSCRTPRTQRQMTTGHHSMSSYFVTAYHTMNFFCFVGF